MDKEADGWKQKGANFFQNQRYEEARACFSTAISLNPNEASYFLNRALCEFQLKNWDSAENDCRKTLILDENNINANYLLGSILLQAGQYDQALVVFRRAYQIAKEQRKSFCDDIMKLIRLTRHEIREADEHKRLNQEMGLKTYINSLIDGDVKRKIKEKIKSKNAGNANAIRQEIDRIKQHGQVRKEQANNIFAQRADYENMSQINIPDCFCGRIDLELLKDPVMTPSGITYERDEILLHLGIIGHFDPVTRRPLTADQLVTNHALRDAVAQYVKDNPWVLHYRQ